MKITCLLRFVMVVFCDNWLVRKNLSQKSLQEKYTVKVVIFIEVITQRLDSVKKSQNGGLEYFTSLWSLPW